MLALAAGFSRHVPLSPGMRNRGGKLDQNDSNRVHPQGTVVSEKFRGMLAGGRLSCGLAGSASKMPGESVHAGS